ncbi:MAG: type II 3-dehydroquinate dehydratase [Saprospiraceae bacterium]
MKQESTISKKIINIAIVNGPNLNLLGRRQPEIYGTKSFIDYYKELVLIFEGKVKLHYFQSNHEGAIIDYLQKIGFDYNGIVLNAGAYSHTSIAIADCVSAITCNVVEVHISNIKERESFRHFTYLEAVCQLCIIGKGLNGYQEAIEYLLEDLN